MSAPQPTRADLIERIRASSKDAVVLAEMQRLGFWPHDEAQPPPAAGFIEHEAALMKELATLQESLRLKGDPETALRAMRKERLDAARAQREQNARAREQRRHERALQWHAARQTQVVYLGAGASAGLQQPASADHARLAGHGLPALYSPQALAQAMGIDLAELKFLSYHREVARSTHYRRFTLPKKTGGERLISAPMPRLKRAQYWVLENILAKVAAHQAAHGFLPARSIVSNAQPHCGQDVVINLDVKDFFPSIAFGRIKGVFMHLGYPEAVATVLALLCSENRCDELLVDGQRYFVGGKARERVLPQGAPTSPMLTNLLCRRLDRRLAGVAHALGFAYTRYADDLSFSASGEASQRVGMLLRRVRWTLREEGFTPHPDKERVMRKGARQEVTGVVVNDGAGVSRRKRRALRAALHRAQRSGVEQATWEGEPASRDRLLGYAHFVRNVNAAQGQALVEAARALPVGPATTASTAAAVSFRWLSAQGKAPERAAGPWWTPAPRPEPARQRTDGEMREERAARRRAAAEERQRAEAEALPATPGVERRAADPVGEGDVQTAAADDAAMPPSRMRGIYWLQMIVVWLTGAVTRSNLVTLAGLVYLVAAYYLRRQRWKPFLVVLAGIASVSYLLRGD